MTITVGQLTFPKTGTNPKYASAQEAEDAIEALLQGVVDQLGALAELDQLGADAVDGLAIRDGAVSFAKLSVALQGKIDGIEAGADVTDLEGVSGALNSASERSAVADDDRLFLSAPSAGDAFRSVPLLAKLWPWINDKVAETYATAAALGAKVGDHAAPVDTASIWYIAGRRVVWAASSSEDQAALGVLENGGVLVGGDVAEANSTWYYQGQKVHRAFVDAQERPSLIVTEDGTAHVPNIQGEILASVPIQCWGDSLTYGDQDGTGVSYPAKLAELLGVPTVNHGIGSQTSKQISMRNGGRVATVTISGNQITTGENTVTHLGGVEISTSGGMAADSDHPFPLSAAASNATRSLEVVIQGVPGTLQRTATGGPPSTSETYTFTPTDETYLPVTCPAGSAVIVQNQPAHKNISIFWLGRNDFTEPDQVKQSVADCVARLDSGAKRFLVLGVLNGDGPSERTGNANYGTIVGLNNDLAVAYPGAFVDIRRRLISEGLRRAGITATAQDLTDLSNDTVPTSLRTDGIHLNAQGYTVLAEILKEEITRRGWVQ